MPYQLPSGRNGMSFVWHPSGPPPTIEEHSKAKLAVFRQYIRSYYDRLSINPSRDEFKLDLVDGFAGGGTFSDGGRIESGTPLVVLEETDAAQIRLNQTRTKPLVFDCKFHFVDVDRAHTDHLRRVLAERGFPVDGERVTVRTSPFANVVDDIIADILRRQPRAGRAIFLLDQTGFSKVELALIARIFQKLPAAEVILTFAADALINHLAVTPQLVQAVAPLELTGPQINDLVQLKDGDGGKALVQRVLRQHVRAITGATFDTPFFIRPKHSRRALWFLHLSRHPTARDVMIQCHWNSFNKFEHYGSGDFNMLGWDALDLNGGTLPLFSFDQLDAERLKGQLLDSMPAELYGLASENPVSVETMRHMLANRTAARFSDLEEIVIKLASEREFDILTSDGKVRSRTLQRLSSSDRIAVPQTPMFPGWSRRR